MSFAQTPLGAGPDAREENPRRGLRACLLLPIASRELAAGASAGAAAAASAVPATLKMTHQKESPSQYIRPCMALVGIPLQASYCHRLYQSAA
jgi:hypothetical protein